MKCEHCKRNITEEQQDVYSGGLCDTECFEIGVNLEKQEKQEEWNDQNEREAQFLLDKRKRIKNENIKSKIRFERELVTLSCEYSDNELEQRDYEFN